MAEDSPDDVLLVRRAFKKLAIDQRLVVANNGGSALDYLEGKGLYANRAKFPLPKLILLDLDLPRVSGFQVLDWVRRNPDLRHIPVIVLTGSVYSPDVTRAYQLGANSFLTKPADLTEFTSVVKEMARFWLNRCALPASTAEASLESKIIEFPAGRTASR